MGSLHNMLSINSANADWDLDGRGCKMGERDQITALCLDSLRTFPLMWPKSMESNVYIRVHFLEAYPKTPKLNLLDGLNHSR